MAKVADNMSRKAKSLLQWFDARLPVSSFWNAVMTGYYAPKNFNFWYYMGSLALLVLVIQISAALAEGVHQRREAGTRFRPLGFSVAPETLARMHAMVAAGEVDALVPERVWQETERALGEPAPEAWLRLLHDCGALARILPELDALYGVPQPEQWHPEIDTGLHMSWCCRRRPASRRDRASASRR